MQIDLINFVKEYFIKLVATKQRDGKHHMISNITPSTTHATLLDQSESQLPQQYNPLINETLSMNGCLKNNKTLNQTSILLDTGSNLSIASSSIIDPEKLNKLQPTGILITSANGTNIPVLGKTNITIEIENTNFKIPVTVVRNITSNIILGNDFLTGHNAVIDFKNKIIKLDNDKNTITVKIQQKWLNTLNLMISNNETLIIKTTKDIIIPHGQKTQVSINIPLSRTTASQIDNNIHLLNNKHCHVIWDNKNNPQFQTATILNKGKHNIHLLKNTILGQLTNQKRITETHALQNNNENTTLSHQLTDNAGNPIDINPDLTEDEMKKAKSLISKYIHLFATNEVDFKESKLEPYTFKVMDETPVTHPPYRLPIAQRQELDRQINELQKAGIIKESQSPYSSPAFLVSKKDGGYRLVVDYRRLNDKIIPDKYPLPLIQTIFDSLENSTYFSTLDISQAFFQQKLTEDCQQKVAFITYRGQFSFTRLPFGLKTSPNAFQRAINKAFNDLLYSSIVIYLDDILSFAPDFEKQYVSLEKTLQRIEATGLTLKTSKCHLFYTSIKLLGHIISKDGIKPNDENLEAVKNFPVPKRVKDVRAFLGLSGFYRKFIENYAQIAKPLTELTKKECEQQPFIWNDMHNAAFEELKARLIAKPVLIHFQNDNEVSLFTDASFDGISGVLSQPDENGKTHPVAYVSRKLTKSERHWAVAEIEMLAITYSINYFRQYLIGRNFTVHTDHKSLEYYKNWKHPSTRISKLLLKLTEFTFTIKYTPGCKMNVPDALSRYPTDKDISDLTENENFSIFKIQNIDIREAQAQDSELSNLILAIKEPYSEQLTEKILRKSRKYEINDGILYFKNFNGQNIELKTVIPKSLITNILTTYHDSPDNGAHVGILKTTEKIRQHYYWDNMLNDIQQYVKSCLQCQERKIPSTKKDGLLCPIEIPQKPFSKIVIDYIGPFEPSNQNKFILTIVDSTTRYIIAYPCKAADADNTIHCLQDLMLRYGAPECICSDRGSHYVNKKFKNLTDSLNIKHILGSTDHSQAQGMAERANRSVQDMLTTCVNENLKTWSTKLPRVLFAYNTSKQTSTKYTPFFALHGFHPNTPLELILETKKTHLSNNERLQNLNIARGKIRENLLQAQSIQKHYYDRNRNSVTYTPGQLVMVFGMDVRPGLSRKLRNLYTGPYEVIEKVSPFVYSINYPLRGRYQPTTFHVDRLKPFFIRKELK